MSNQISNSKIGEDGLVMLLSSNGTILANRDNHMIGETLFGNQLAKMLKDTSKIIMYRISYRIRTIFYVPQDRAKWYEYCDRDKQRRNSSKFIKRHYPY